MVFFFGGPLMLRGRFNSIFIGFVFPTLCLIIKLQAARAIAYLAYRLLYIAATLGFILICIVASTTSLTLIYMLAILGIYMLIKGVLKAQYYSFILFNLVLPTAATLGLMLICIVVSCTSLLLIYINASRAGFILILIYINASHIRRIQAFLV